MNMKGILFIMILAGSALQAAPRYVVQKQSKHTPRMILATVKNDQAGPLVKVSFEDAPELGYELYAQQVSVGTSGVRFKYYAKTNDGLELLGEFPELLYEKESGLWVSHEKDGPRLLRTTYRFQGKSISVQSEELITTP